MGREVRMIKPGWEHPTNGTYHDGSIRYNPLFEGPYEEEARLWDLKNAKWNEGLEEDWSLENKNWRSDPWFKPKGEAALKYETFAEWDGERPVPEDYMPTWAPGEATQYVMYETTSEGTPISPPFDTPEELAHWLADNEASSFADCTSTYEEWLQVCKGRSAISAVMTNGVIESGVTALANIPVKETDRKQELTQRITNILINAGVVDTSIVQDIINEIVVVGKA